MTKKKAFSRAGVEPAPLGSKYRPSELPFILIVTLKKKEEKEMGVGAYITGCLLTKPSRLLAPPVLLLFILIY